VLHILVALSTEERHGYGIMKQVESDSHGRVKMGPGTLYGSLKRMLDAGLVKESAKRPDPRLSDERRIYYRITALGRSRLADELKRYKQLVELTEGRKLMPETYTYGR
jgi:DNA-binding PadR family transcriptional regulator